MPTSHHGTKAQSPVDYAVIDFTDLIQSINFNNRSLPFAAWFMPFRLGPSLKSERFHT